jgi:C4-dicarboxylate-specific signal transduction histidine kinase
MAAAITHEINNPLAVILGRAEMMQSLIERGKVEPETLSRLVETILTTGKRIEKIVRSMKALAHQSTGEEPFQTTPLREVLADAAELCSQRFRNHRIKLTVAEAPPELTVECLSHEIVQVLVNLLNNAFDAVSDQDGAWVRLDLLEKANSVELSVSDSGSGISLETQAKLFQPFFSTKRVQYGTGLGLSISRGILKNHKGNLYYDNESPNTRFVIELPKKMKQPI